MNKGIYEKYPYYLQIREFIYNKIVSGEYKAGEKIPSEEELAEMFGVSRMTVTKALTELVNKEYLIREQGRGTFVSKVRKEGTQLDIIGFNDSMVKKGFNVGNVVFESKLILPPKDIAAKLNIPITQKVLYLKRLREINENPIVLQESYVNVELCPEIIDIDFAKDSLYSVIRKHYEEGITRAKDTIEAISADEETSKLLNTDVGFPILLSKRLAFIKNDIPIEYSNSLYRSDQYVIEIEYKA